MQKLREYMAEKDREFLKGFAIHNKISILTVYIGKTTSRHKEFKVFLIGSTGKISFGACAITRNLRHLFHYNPKKEVIIIGDFSGSNIVSSSIHAWTGLTVEVSEG